MVRGPGKGRGEFFSNEWKTMRSTRCNPSRITLVAMTDAEIHWMNTNAAARRLGVTVRTLYRMIDRGDLPAYQFGRVIRLKHSEVDAFIESSRIAPGSLEHLYPDSKKETTDIDSKRA